MRWRAPSVGDVGEGESKPRGVEKIGKGERALANMSDKEDGIIFVRRQFGTSRAKPSLPQDRFSARSQISYIKSRWTSRTRAYRTAEHEVLYVLEACGLL